MSTDDEMVSGISSKRTDSIMSPHHVVLVEHVVALQGNQTMALNNTSMILPDAPNPTATADAAFTSKRPPSVEPETSADSAALGTLETPPATLDAFDTGNDEFITASTRTVRMANTGIDYSPPGGAHEEQGDGWLKSRRVFQNIRTNKKQKTIPTGWISNKSTRRLTKGMEAAKPFLPVENSSRNVRDKIVVLTSEPATNTQPDENMPSPPQDLLINDHIERGIPDTIPSHQQQQQQRFQNFNHDDHDDYDNREDDNVPLYRYRETVRCKAARQNLPCRHDCEECSKFYQAVCQGRGEELFSKQRLMGPSRHRARFSPENTPDNFWDLSFRDEVVAREQLERGGVGETDGGHDDEWRQPGG
jgi:hypothetical protein